MGTLEPHVHGPQCVPQTFWGRVRLFVLEAFGGKKPAPLSDKVAIHLDNLCVHYGDTCIIHHITGQFKPKAMTAIMGPNGGGKSTLLKALLGLQQNIQGSIQFTEACPYDVAYLAQHNILDKRFPLSVGDVVSLGLFKQLGAFRKVQPEHEDLIRKALARVGMSGAMETPLQALSGGQFQRVLFARLILQDAPIIFLDEPFTGVDSRTVKDLMGLIQEWHKEGRMVVAILHDMDLVLEYFPETLLIARKCLGWGKSRDILTTENLSLAAKAARDWESSTESHHA